MSLREGAGLFALALLVPLAIEGLFIAALWPLIELGQRPGFAEGTTVTVGVLLFVLVLSRYVLLASYWTWLALAHGSGVRTGLLAALPVVGIVWALKLAARVARGDHPYRPLAVPTRAVLIAISVLALLLVPVTMQYATAYHLAGQDRLSAPCTVLPPTTDVAAPVVALGRDGIDASTLQSWSQEVADTQSASALRDPAAWSREIADQFLQLALTERTAERLGVTASVGDMERVRDDFRATVTSAQGSYDPVRTLAMPRSWEEPYYCAWALGSALLERYPDSDVDPDTGRTPYDAQILATANRLGVEVDPTIGYWNPEVLAITADPPPPTVVEEQESTTEAAPAVTYDTRVEYETASIPTGEFPGTREWNADICIGDAALLQPTYLNRVQLFERVAGQWRRVPGAQASAERGGRCDGGQVNLLIGGEADESPAVWFDKGFRTCVPYQVRIPETPRFQPVSVDMCVSTQAVTDGGQA